jgi:hypothetical protein
MMDTSAPARPNFHARRWLVAVVGLHLLLGLVYDWATPIFEASDEGAHYAVIHWLAQGRSLPVQEPGTPEKPWAQEGSQPPLYYFLGAGLTAWVDTRDFEQIFVRNPHSRVGVPGATHNVNLYRHPAQPTPLAGTALAVRLVRWFSLALSGGTIALTAQLARRVFPGREQLACLAAALVAFNPMALFINASVNNDNLLMLLSTAALLVSVDFTQSAVPRSSRKAAALGVLLGLAALTKVSGLVLWPIAALGVGWGMWRRAEGGRQRAVHSPITDCCLLLLTVFGVALAVCGWWFWRNYALYGEWLGLDTMVAVAGPRVPPITLGQLIRDEWVGFWLSYWGIFGAFTVRAGDWVYLFFDALTVWALAGGVWALFRSRQWPRPALLLLGLFCALTLVGVVRWTMQTFASQGRLMFGAIAPLSIFMAAGLISLLELPPLSQATRLRTFDFALGTLTTLLALIAALAPVADIAPRYRPPPAIGDADLPSDLRPVHVRFGDGIELIGYTSENAPRAPGDAQAVTLYWRALKPMNADDSLALLLTGRSTAEVGKIDTWPGGGNLPTSQWKPGAIYADQYLIPIDPQAEAPSLLNLYLTIGGGGSGGALPITTESGEPLSSVKMIVGRVVPASPPRFSPKIVADSAFEHGIQLLGVDVEPGGKVALYWQTDGPVPGDYTVFLHLYANGVFLTQADAPPLAGDWPTSAWVPGQPFADVHQFELPPELPPGPYSLRLGFYDPASNARLAAFRADGAEWPDDVMIVENIKIER